MQINLNINSKIIKKMLLIILETEKQKWKQQEDPLSTLSSIIILMFMYLKSGSKNRIKIVTNKKIIFDSDKYDPPELQTIIANEDTKSDLSSDLAYALCLINKCKIDTRILIITFQSTLDMKCVFAAQKMNLRIDSVCFNGNEILRCFNGIYFREGCLNKFFLRILGCEKPKTISVFKTLCACHKKDILVGLVCPVCLSVYCKVIPLCKVCKIRFDFVKF